MARSRIAGSLLLLAALLCAGPAEAGNEGEARSPLREPDRPYSVVAGDAEASAVVQNPANLGYLRGFNGVIDVSWNLPNAARRGSGAGVFAAVPLPWQILALGVGLQMVSRQQVTPSDDVRSPDSLAGKFTLALALPLMRWAPGLSIGVNYSRLFSRDNALTNGANQVDLGISWRANRFVTIALVGRNLNAPRLGPEGQQTRIPIALDPELALRPLGTPRLELAFGMRTSFVEPEQMFRPHPVQPRGRLLVGVEGLRVYAEAERLTYFGDPPVAPIDGVRISAGIEFDTPHFGMAAGINFGAGSRPFTVGTHGAHTRLRFSHERYDEVLSLRPRRVTRLSLAGKSDDRSLADLVSTLDQLAARGGAVVLIETSGLGFGFAQLEELRAALGRVQDSGGKVAVYMQGGNLRHYFLATVADRLIAHPESGLGIVGLSLTTFYWSELLDKLGARAEFVRVGEYKGTPEQWMRQGPTAPVAEAQRLLLTDTWNHVIRSIGRARGHDPTVVSGWIDLAPWEPDEARRRGLVDALAWPDELDEELEGWLGRRVRIEAPPEAPPRPAAWGTPAHVAVLHVEGTMVTDESLRIPLLDVELAGASTLAKQIEELREDASVKAVVVRIDSRGGSVAAARRIARELDLLREAGKPVVVSIGETATSGGYWAATAGQYIYADATSKVGGIGVFQAKIDLSGTLERFGIDVALLSIGDRATLRSWWKPYSDDEREAALAAVQAEYDRFIERVADARAMTPEDADELARGRIWSGVRASEVGLVDRHGGMFEAVARAARMAELPGMPEVRHYPAPPTLLEKIQRLWGLDISLPFGQGTGGLTSGSLAIDPLTAAGLRFADPTLRALQRLPAPLWLGDQPETLAMEVSEIEIDD